METLRYYKKGLIAFAGTVIAGLTWALENGNGISGLEGLAIASMVLGITVPVTRAQNGPRPARGNGWT